MPSGGILIGMLGGGWLILMSVGCGPSGRGIKPGIVGAGTGISNSTLREASSSSA